MKSPARADVAASASGVNQTGAAIVEERTVIAKEHGTETVVRKRLDSIKPSPENLELYSPIDPDDPEVQKLAEQISAQGLLEPLVVTQDNYIVAGHRRYTALTINEQVWVKCRVYPGRRDAMSRDDYIALLREYNRQRSKSVAEQVREELVDVNPAEAHRRLCRLRDKSVNAVEHNGVEVLEIEGAKKRYGISDDKAAHVEHILKVLQGRRGYWPLSVRGVHYPLLDYRFVRGYWWPRRNQEGHGTRQELWYGNDEESYKATSELLTRLRLNGTVSWAALDDGTRPHQEFNPFRHVRQFVRQQLSGLLTGYWRDLLQSQPNYVEILVEKNTVYHMAQRIARKYQVPISSGRGFNSIDPYHDLAQRYKYSRKKWLNLIVLSDYDTEGELIPHVAGRTLRDDFGIDKLRIIKAGVTREQIERYSLPEMLFAKESSSNFEWFVERNGGDNRVWELEALDPAAMLTELEAAVQGVLDMELFNREAAIEQEEAGYLDAVRRTVADRLRGLTD